MLLHFEDLLSLMTQRDPLVPFDSSRMKEIEFDKNETFYYDIEWIVSFFVNRLIVLLPLIYEPYEYDWTKCRNFSTTFIIDIGY